MTHHPESMAVNSCVVAEDTRQRFERNLNDVAVSLSGAVQFSVKFVRSGAWFTLACSNWRVASLVCNLLNLINFACEIW